MKNSQALMSNNQPKVIAYVTIFFYNVSLNYFFGSSYALYLSNITTFYQKTIFYHPSNHPKRFGDYWHVHDGC